jgi:integrase
MAMYTWLWEIEKIKLKSSTFDRNEGIYRNYVKDESIGKLPVSEFKTLTLQKHYNSLADEGKTISQIKNLNKLLKKFFNFAIHEGYLIKNPCAKVQLVGKDEERVIETFCDDELKVINGMEESKIKYIMKFALVSGLRAGEILALTKDDIKNMVVNVDKTVNFIKVFDSKTEWHYENRVEKPKTKSSIREVPLPSTFESDLKKIELLQKMEQLKAGPVYHDNNLLFPSVVGTHIDTKNLRKLYMKTLEKLGIEYKNFHALRHTYATKLFEKGASLLTVSKLLGHTTTKTTEVYTHVLKDVKIKEVELLKDIFQ